MTTESQDSTTTETPVPETPPAAPDALPTAPQRELLCQMIGHAFVELRTLGWGNYGAQAADLADAFQNIPNEMYGRGGFSWSFFREKLESYQTKWRGNSAFGGRNFVAMLDEIRKMR